MKWVGYRIPSSKGFTLIETLVSGLLLFAVIALVSQAYSAALLNEQRAVRAIERAHALKFIRQLIDEEIREAPTLEEGSGRWKQLTYQWRVSAENTKYSRAGTDIDTGQQVAMGTILILREIEVTIGEAQHSYVSIDWQ